jgi:hypothetical protein
LIFNDKAALCPLAASGRRLTRGDLREKSFAQFVLMPKEYIFGAVDDQSSVFAKPHSLIQSSGKIKDF